MLGLCWKKYSTKSLSSVWPANIFLLMVLTSVGLTEFCFKGTWVRTDSLRHSAQLLLKRQICHMLGSTMAVIYPDRSVPCGHLRDTSQWRLASMEMASSAAEGRESLLAKWSFVCLASERKEGTNVQPMPRASHSANILRG